MAAGVIFDGPVCLNALWSRRQSTIPSLSSLIALIYSVLPSAVAAPKHSSIGVL